MPMKKKDYEAIATEIVRGRVASKEHAMSVDRTLNLVARGIALHCSSRPEFNTERFLKACGVKP